MAVVGAAIVAWWRSRRSAEPVGDADRPEAPPPVEPAPVVEAPPPVESAPAWVEPVDGGCPDGYPVKVNERSGIFHVPGGLSYERTNPSRCYATAEGAEADGFRRAKR